MQITPVLPSITPEVFSIDLASELVECSEFEVLVRELDVSQELVEQEVQPFFPVIAQEQLEFEELVAQPELEIGESDEPIKVRASFLPIEARLAIDWKPPIQGQPMDGFDLSAASIEIVAKEDGPQSGKISDLVRDYVEQAPIEEVGRDLPRRSESGPVVVDPLLRSVPSGSTESLIPQLSSSPIEPLRNETQSVQVQTTPPSVAISTPAAQIALAVNGTGETITEIVLTPEELGTVKIKLEQTADTMIVHVTAERPETHDLIRRNVSDLTRELSDIGYDNVDLSFGDNENHQQEKERETARALIRGEKAIELSWLPFVSEGLDLRL